MNGNLLLHVIHTPTPHYAVVLLREILMTVLVSYFLLSDQCPFFTEQGYGSTQTYTQKIWSNFCDNKLHTVRKS